MSPGQTDCYGRAPMKKMLAAFAVLVATAGPAAAAAPTTPAELIPLTFAVCVTLTSDPTHPHVDSFFVERDDARARRREIVREGWVRVGENGNEEDESGPLTILKATVEETSDGGSICV